MTTLSTQLFHGIRALTTTIGTGSVTLVSDTSYMKPLARLSAGALLSYSLLDGSSREWGIGTVQSADVFDRTTITGTETNGVYTSGGTALDLSGGVTIFECTLHEATVILVDQVNNWLKGQSGEFITLTSSSNAIAINLDNGNNFKHTLTENTTLGAATGAAITNTKSQSGIIYIKQHASSAKTFAFNSFWKFNVAFSMTSTLSGYSGFSYTTRPDGSAADCTQFV